ncbi:hypothetical protein NFI96_027601 [Prochilodus magdalenae]|nr:hypothetical protein NFI96_027601 [Prochilodus magdalenae]
MRRGQLLDHDTRSNKEDTEGNEKKIRESKNHYKWKASCSRTIFDLASAPSSDQPTPLLSLAITQPSSSLSFTREQMRRELTKMKAKKAVGPDNINPAHVPIPNTEHPSYLHGYRPVALTSHLLKALERLVLTYLHSPVGSAMDPLQFAYQPSIGDHLPSPQILCSS